MFKDSELKQVYSVTEVATILGFSRAMMYQHKNKGVFPSPVYCPYTRRPFYTAELLQKCLDIRRTGRGFNGRSIVFNQRVVKNKEAQKQNDGEKLEQFYVDIMKFFKRNLGENYAKNDIKKIVSEVFPNGLTEYKFNDKVADAIVEYLFGSSKNTVKEVSTNNTISVT
jgi:hypothetical protein